VIVSLDRHRGGDYGDEVDIMSYLELLSPLILTCEIFMTIISVFLCPRVKSRPDRHVDTNCKP
jgi:hypothetical protein